MQEAVQVHRLLETVPRGMQPRCPKRETPRPSGRPSSLLRAASLEERPIRKLRRRRTVIAENEQRGAERGHVATRHVRLVETGESGAEAGGFENEGTAE